MRQIRNSDGFSLVELILTVVILAVIAAVSIPKFFNQSTFDERFFSDDVLAATRYASKLAIASGCSVRLSINASGYQLDQDSNCDFTSPNFNISVQRPDDNTAYSNTD
ncbi:MAG: prepilin-type N-terminal cleavage/methylation domain-containing protein, partial [Enterobacterales bacterium]|nr:prepilin-type N-terminal cleavage/methylation domain-containing protein [Enterobacterales bacterium]